MISQQFHNQKMAEANDIKDFKAPLDGRRASSQRHQLILKALHGEHNGKYEKIRIYGEESLFNMDKSGLFYKLIPSKSLENSTKRIQKL